MISGLQGKVTLDDIPWVDVKELKLGYPKSDDSISVSLTATQKMT